MDGFKPYHGRTSTSHRRHGSVRTRHLRGVSKSSLKLYICLTLLLIAVGLKLVFPEVLHMAAKKLDSAMNYKAALASLGEGISGEKKMTTALGEAFSYAFLGTEAAGTLAVSPSADGTTRTRDVTPQNTVQSIVQASPSIVPAEQNTQVTTNSAQDNTASDGEDVISKAVISAFLQGQEQYSDYAIPAGVTYDMPSIGVAFTAPLQGAVSSSFGYRVHPIEKSVKFHYGTDVAAKEGTIIKAFSDGKVIAAGKSESLGNYIVISQKGVESEYAHCSKLYVKSGQTVQMGDKIAAVGKTGNATEACLHFELRISGAYVNSEYYVKWS